MAQKIGTYRLALLLALALVGNSTGYNLTTLHNRRPHTLYMVRQFRV